MPTVDFQHNWDNSYTRRENHIFEPYEELVKFLFRYLCSRSDSGELFINPAFSSKKIADLRILDLGCGIGAQSIYCAQLGFQVVGVDHSEVAIAKAREIALRASVNVDFKIIKDDTLPQDIGDFDIVLACASLDSMPKEAAVQYLDQVLKIFNFGGLFFATLIGQATDNQYLDQMIVEESFEQGTLQSFFDEQKIKIMFDLFCEILRLEVVEHKNVIPNKISRSSSRWYLTGKRK
jgi:2-polyprenyl-3-methyl-5-hydroxy-6-metoxy-1,4-benzoquinol methylase